MPMCVYFWETFAKYSNLFTQAAQCYLLKTEYRTAHLWTTVDALGFQGILCLCFKIRIELYIKAEWGCMFLPSSFAELQINYLDAN